MSPPLLFGLVSVAAVSIWSTRAQFSNITCTSQHAWMSNSRGQNPCLVAAYLSVPCVGETAAVDGQLDDPGEFYDGPLFGPDECSCNTVMYSMVEACQLCQFDSGGGPEAWSAWSRNCTTTKAGSYPMAIQPGTAVPAWAYLDVVKADRFNETAAQLVAAAGVPESTAVPSSSTSTTITATFSTDSATSQSTSSTASGQPTATDVGAAVGSGSQKSDPKGPLVGGIVGGVLGILLIGALVFYILLRHRRLTSAAHAQPESGPALSSTEATISRSGTPGLGPYGHPAALKERMMSPTTDSVVYDPDDPRTFPPERVTIGRTATATMGGSVDGHMRETGPFAGDASSLGYRPSVVGSIYRGAPEVSS